MVSPDIQGLGLSDKLLEHYKREVGEMALGILDGKPFDSPVHEGILITCMLELLPYDDSDKSEFPSTWPFVSPMTSSHSLWMTLKRFAPASAARVMRLLLPQ